MSAKLSVYSGQPEVKSTLLLKTPDSIPPTNELELLHDELKELKKLTLLRAKKASEDLKTIEESMRRMNEKEKGKAKAIDRVKREHDFIPLPDAEDTKSVKSLHGHLIKPRLTSHPITSLPPSARSSLDPRRSAADDLKKKKKKRKREPGDSDGEHDLQRPRKSTPPANHSHSHSHSQPPKAQKSVASTSQPHTKLPPGPDFSVPPSIPLLSPRPPIPPPPIPGPSKPTEVTEDFSKSKQPAQILVSSFYSSIEPWIRNIREEDVGFLEYTGDEVEPYIMPKLGRHYTEIWEDQDAGLLPATVLGDAEAPPFSFSAPVPKWDPSTLMEPDLVTEDRGHGPLTERVISALLPMPDMTVWKGVKAAEDAMEGRPGGSGAAAARREKMNVSDLESRIRDTMRYHGLLDGVPDYTEKVDDPIATALRHAQRELRNIVATNKARKEQLVDIARDRLGYQEYLELRDSIDKNITNAFSKLQKKDGPKVGKKKKKIIDNGDGNGAAPAPVPCPAALGMTPDEDNKLHVSDQLQHLVEIRRQWVDTVGSVFDEKQKENPGRIWGFPPESIYQSVEDEVRMMLLASNPAPGPQVAKAQETSRGDEMDVS